MDADEPQLTPSLAATAELFRRERPVLTLDEIGRIDRRLHARPPRRRRSSLAVAFCAALGLVFSTAGTGLAISGFATPDKAVHAQYPSRAAGTGQPSGSSGGGGRAPAHAKRSGPTTLRDAARARRSADDRTGVFRAATRTGGPFTGYGAIPILVVGLAFFVTGAIVNRRPHGRQ
jgi:hypothetical protein